ncbi:Protein LMBR1L [Bienertia sinuspersici]
MSRIWTATVSIFRWSEMGILGASSSISSIFRWPEFDFSNFSTERLQWLNFWVVDNVLWNLVTLIESLALLFFLCFFYTFCGCTL